MTTTDTRRRDDAATRPAAAEAVARRPWPALTRATVRRMAPALVCAGFVLLCLLQAPGEIVGDTKLDLAVDPLDFLGRAASLWEAEGYAGQLQYQAYGYFFPMGPFFTLGHLLGLPVWVVQRLWLAALMCTAFLGVVLLARRLGIGTPSTVLLAGIAYAMAPRMLSVMTATSVEVTPMALAPWVLVPLAGLSRHGSPRRAAALSGLAVLGAGGVNAVAAAAVFPLAVLYLATRPAGPLRRRLAGWWALCAGLATLWWVVPLLLLGRYSPTVLPYVETAVTTTAHTDVLSVLRGTTYWIAAMASPSTGPHLPAGWSLLHDGWPIAATLGVAVAGLVGLTRRDLPERTWLVLGLLIGVALVSMGHLATVEGVWAGSLHDAIDHGLAPLRNVHKFDPVLRLPLALGLAHLAAVLVAAARRRGTRSRAAAWAGRTTAALALVAVVLPLAGTTAPALAGRIGPPTGFADIPAHWQATADFLATEQPSGRALLVPASNFGSYEWGRPADEPLQALADSPWEVRSILPMTPEAHTRTLDTIERRLASGKGSAGLTGYLARAGISHLVLRNDLDATDTQSTRPALVRQALDGSPGITRVAAFGADHPRAALPPRTVYDAGLGDPAPAVEIYAVADPAPRAWTAPLASAVTVHGGPETVLALEDRGLVSGRPVLLAGEPVSGTGAVMVGDALQRRERNFGRVTDALSAAMTADALPVQGRPHQDYLLPGMARAQSVVAHLGGTPTASSSASDIVGVGGSHPGSHPWAAVDSDLRTAWRPAVTDPGRPRPDWWRLTTERSFDASEVVVVLGAELGGERPRRLRVTTDAGSAIVRVRDSGEPQALRLPPGPTRTLTISGTTEDPGAPALVLTELAVPGVALGRTVVTPTPSAAADAYAFDAGTGRPGCLAVQEGLVRCAAELVDLGEEPAALDRTFSTVGDAEHELAVAVTGRPGPALDALLAAARGGPQAAASSVEVYDPRGGAAAAVDGDPRTSWLAGGGDERPTIVLAWPEPRLVDSLRILAEPGAAVLEAVTVAAADRSVTVRPDGEGTVRFEPVVTDRLEITVEPAERRRSFDPYTLWTRPLGIAISEIEVGGPNPPAPADTPVLLPCGEGPALELDGRPIATRLETTLGALGSMRQVPLTLCDGAELQDLSAGEHRLVATGTAALTVDAATLTRVGGDAGASAAAREAAAVTRWDVEHREVTVGVRDEDALLVVPENTNPGWTATLDGRQLRAVVVDGWQQGYVLPAGPAGTVVLDFAPGSTYRTALLAGGLAIGMLVVLALLPVRPGRTLPTGGRDRAAPPLRDVVLALVAVGGMAFVAGPVGVGALLGLWAVTAPLRRYRPAALAVAAGGSLAAAGLLLLVDPAGTGTARQVLAVVALGAVVAGLLPVPSRVPAGLSRVRGWLRWAAADPGRA
ncbi:alpha-(1-_3)-arabinofuranosyltransferase family protein [Blastococcus sp. CCUG 61487]|uniref:alpha-(1->3)-arabinofuranosyltransferase domain-containing protein n=1 Tax=Blastococcus sp. CCUG 61487 TaxID=1840703 RepID=UPI0010C01098|nr:alpha-(1->3)-arabinofuranosyltransferase family protein [Blastococcus sp. CCUG 61487]TKJ32129.1 hypothetical protein A6V29_17330 [Blastococcus sp. CCUG 61487]